MWKTWWRTNGPILILGIIANCLTKELDWQRTVPRAGRGGLTLWIYSDEKWSYDITRVKPFALLLKRSTTAEVEICSPQLKAYKKKTCLLSSKQCTLLLSGIFSYHWLLLYLQYCVFVCFVCLLVCKYIKWNMHCLCFFFVFFFQYYACIFFPANWLSTALVSRTCLMAPFIYIILQQLNCHWKR